MLEKNIEAFAQILEDFNLKETAAVFKQEFSSKSNDEYELGKFNIMKQLTNQLSKYLGRHISNSYYPTSRKKFTQQQQDNPIFNSFISKLSTKLKQNEEKENKKDQEEPQCAIDQNSKVFIHLKNKYEEEFNAKKNKQKRLFSNSPQNLFSNLEGNNNEVLDELPCFGSGSSANVQKDLLTDFEMRDDLLLNINDAEEVKKQKGIEESKQDVNIYLGSVDQLAGEMIDEYVDDDDPGFDLYECDKEYFADTCKKLSEQYNFPQRGIYKSKYANTETTAIPFADAQPKIPHDNIKCISLDSSSSNTFKVSNDSEQNALWKNSQLSDQLNFPKSNDTYYPVYYNNSFIDSYKLQFVIDRERTGFEESKDFKIIINNIIAGRYQILAYLGNAAFSKAVKCLDILENRLVCLKIIENNKDYFDQSLDEIKMLRFININGDSQEKHFLKLLDYFYYKEHLFIVTELLKDNLYDLYDYLSKSNIDNYFTLPRIQTISVQILQCLEYIHSLHIIHCDLKPENILMKSIGDVVVKVIDFGSSNFIHDRLSSYIQSRSYRAPEVILGCKYDYKIDIWSLGCIIAELNSGNVLFQSDSIQSLFARVIGIAGPIPDWMYDKGKNSKDYFTKEKLIYMDPSIEGGDKNASEVKAKKMHIIIPKKTAMKKRLKTEDEDFLDFVRNLLQIDPNLRPTAQEALKHKWITSKKYS